MFAPAISLEPITTSYPASRIGKNVSKWSMDVELSASINTRISPVTCVMPYRTAYPFPWFWPYSNKATRGSCAENFFTSCAVPSLGPSFTTATSHVYRCFFKYEVTACKVWGNLCSSLYAGMTTETYGAVLFMASVYHTLHAYE